MIEQTVTVTVSSATLTTLEDVVSLLEWATTTPGVGVSVTATCDGKVVVQADGVNIPAVYAELGDTLTFDGREFRVTKPEPAE